MWRLKPILVADRAIDLELESALHSAGRILMRPGYDRLRHQKELVESCRTLCKRAAGSAVEKRLRIVVENIEYE